MGEGFCDNDEHLALAITSRSHASRVFDAPPTDEVTKTEAIDFVPWGRLHMLMSQQMLHAASPTYQDEQGRALPWRRAHLLTPLCSPLTCTPITVMRVFRPAPRTRVMLAMRATEAFVHEWRARLA